VTETCFTQTGQASPLSVSPEVPLKRGAGAEQKGRGGNSNVFFFSLLRTPVSFYKCADSAGGRQDHSQSRLGTSLDVFCVICQLVLGMMLSKPGIRDQGFAFQAPLLGHSFAN
jgi:hypothetical protein